MIINVTSYIASDSQKKCGVINLTIQENKKLRSLLKVVSTEREDLLEQAQNIANYAYCLCESYKTNKCLIAGKTFLLPFLIQALNQIGIETYMTNVKKVSTFAHGNFLNEQRHFGVVNCSMKNFSID